MKPTIAVLSIQGAFIEHERRLGKMGCTCLELRQAADLALPFDALVLPGGESTTQSKLLRDLGMFDALRERINQGLPTLGTCAGLILLAKRVEGTGDLRGLDTRIAKQRTPVHGFATLPVTVERNAYGRQLGSFHASAPFIRPNSEQMRVEANVDAPIPMTFIRAPRISALDPRVSMLASVDGSPVAVQFRNQIGLAFHPELDNNNRIYEHFLSLL